MFASFSLSIVSCSFLRCRIFLVHYNIGRHCTLRFGSHHCLRPRWSAPLFNPQFSFFSHSRYKLASLSVYFLCPHRSSYRHPLNSLLYLKYVEALRSNPDSALQPRLCTTSLRIIPSQPVLLIANFIGSHPVSFFDNMGGILEVPDM